MIRAFVGAGGKTTLIKRYADKLAMQGKKVLILTSTRMYIEEDTLISDNPGDIFCEMDKRDIVMAGTAVDGKLGPVSRRTYEALSDKGYEILIEADGSRRMPLKIPSENEPVIYDNVDEIIVVCGMSALGKRAEDTIHRMEEKRPKLYGKIVSARMIEDLVMKEYVEPLIKKFPDKRVKIYAAQAETLYERAAAALISSEYDVDMIDENWFRKRPQLLICGGGHVALEVAKAASLLDFDIKVIDDRIEFADSKRFFMADEVICDDFSNLDKYIEDSAYCVVVTRGHKDDAMALRSILKRNISYVGMMGSSAKNNRIFEKLCEEGFAKEVIDIVHAPIGLDIGAVTPAEIAISIMGEIIKVKNKISQASASQKLLETAERGVLCIIIEKTGSSPRGIGTMMFVGEDEVIDTIGGGAVENAVIEDARACREIMIRDYDLASGKDELDMICGGTNRILFIPLEEVK